MRVVIKISEELYEQILRNKQINKHSMGRYDWIISEGVPLPKGCGRLIDAEELKKEYPHDTDWDYPVNTSHCVVKSIDNAPTIIEADPAESEEV